MPGKFRCQYRAAKSGRWGLSFALKGEPCILKRGDSKK